MIIRGDFHSLCSGGDHDQQSKAISSLEIHRSHLTNMPRSTNEFLLKGLGFIFSAYKPKLFVVGLILGMVKRDEGTPTSCKAGPHQNILSDLSAYSGA